MIRQLIAWSGVGCASLGVMGYWAYTLGGQEWLRSAMATPRRTLLLGGTALSMAALPGPLGIAPAISSALLLSYGIKRQWLFPSAAAQVMKSECIPPPDEWIIRVPGAGCIPLKWAARLRTLVLSHESGTYVVSYCSLAKSLRVFVDAPRELAAVLPHATGFYVGAGETWWDGNTGIKVRGPGSDLVSTEFQLIKSQECSGADILTPNGRATLPKPLERTPRIPGARGVVNGMDWGSTDGVNWVEFSDRGPMTSWVLGRWAASSLGLRIPAVP